LRIGAYFKGEEILACEQAGVAVTLPKPHTSGAKSAGRLGNLILFIWPKGRSYRCPAGEKLSTTSLLMKMARNADLLTKACRTCRSGSMHNGQQRRSTLGTRNTSSRPRRRGSIRTRKPLRVRRETVEHPFAN